MPRNRHPRLASSNLAPLPSHTTAQPKLVLVYDGVPNLPETTETALLPSPASVQVLQNLLRAEARFLKRLRTEAANRCSIKTDLEAIQRELNHENVIHVARFFFLLKVLGCDTPHAVEALIDGHNAKVRSLLEAKDYTLRTENELKKAIFKGPQQYVCVRTVKEKGRAVFAKTEIASLLFDHMARASAVNTLDLLVRAGLLIEEDSDPLTGSNRKLIKTDGILEASVEQYLRDVATYPTELEGKK